MSKNPNKLINEKSPYLLQHAYNPVNWFPWCDEAFEKAKQEDKPIFLSIGYSTCHWCHVMERESFEDKEVAKLMNDAFISIKVDREERPDIDGIYMSVCQIITGSGGWPLTVVMTPDKKPFFTGTYFPKRNRFNRIGMMELIPKLKEIWNTRKDEVLKSAEEITASVKNQNFAESFEDVDDSILHKTYNELKNRYDDELGGFGNAPKFPSPHNLMFLLRYWKKQNESKALAMVEKTLTQMRIGGIFDHVGFGFARYSTDRKWLVPHFEKMLYDQALLIQVYTETYLATKNSFYRQTAEEIIEYVLRDMTNTQGAFYSAEDADSQGEEGKFYLWETDELRNILDNYEFNFAVKIFNVSQNGNWVDESKGILPGTNILHFQKTTAELAKEFQLTETALNEKLYKIRIKLFNYRKNRIHPFKDDKILTDWNSLIISALAKAYQAFNNKVYLQAAVKSFTFIEKFLTSKEGKLLHRFKDGEAAIDAYLDDYAFLINALLDLYECTFNIQYFERAVKLQLVLDEEFWDKNSGGYYFTSTNSEGLLLRQKDIYDGAIPSGNSVALLNLARLYKLTTDTSYQTKADEIIKYFSVQIKRSPSAFCMTMCGLDFMFSGSIEIVIVSDSEDNISIKALELIRKYFIPNRVIILNTKEHKEKMSKYFPFTKDMKPVNNKTTFYVCANYTCKQPVNNIEDLERALMTL